MGKGFLSSITILLLSAGLGLGQPGSLPPAGAPSYLPDPAQAVQPIQYAPGPAMNGFAPPPAGMTGFPPPGPAPAGAMPPGCNQPMFGPDDHLAPGPSPGTPTVFRPLYSRNNAFGPKCTHHPADNAFELEEDHPEDLCDNAWMPSNCCCCIGYAQAEFIFWFLRKPLPTPLVTTGPPAPAPAANVGTLSDPNTRILYGGQDLNEATLPGARLTAGYWIESHYLGVEASGFWLSQRTDHFSRASDPNGNSVIARPYFNTTTGLQDRELIAHPGLFAGGVTIGYSTLMGGVEGNLVWNPFKMTYNWPEMLVGFRYVDLEEHLSIDEIVTLLAGGRSSFNGVAVFPPSSQFEHDLFKTRNQFYGANLGLRSRFDFWYLCYLELIGKVGLGTTHETLQIQGSTTLFPAGTVPSQTTQGGLLALASNIGLYHRDNFTVLPEVTANIGVYLCPTVRLFGGYNFLYWPNTVRAGGQLNNSVSATLHPTDPAFNGQVVPGSQPGVLFRQSDFFVHGVNLGLSIEF